MDDDGHGDAIHDRGEDKGDQGEGAKRDPEEEILHSLPRHCIAQILDQVGKRVPRHDRGQPSAPGLYKHDRRSVHEEGKDRILEPGEVREEDLQRQEQHPDGYQRDHRDRQQGQEQHQGGGRCHAEEHEQDPQQQDLEDQLVQEVEAGEDDERFLREIDLGHDALVRVECRQRLCQAFRDYRPDRGAGQDKQRVWDPRLGRIDHTSAPKDNPQEGRAEGGEQDPEPGEIGGAVARLEVANEDLPREVKPFAVPLKAFEQQALQVVLVIRGIDSDRQFHDQKIDGPLFGPKVFEFEMYKASPAETSQKLSDQDVLLTGCLQHCASVLLHSGGG